MKNNWPKWLALSLFIAALLAPNGVAARRGFGWRGSAFSSARWQAGYWYHGAYMGRDGWWWIAGPSWYLYPSPVYPYPDYEAEPVYAVKAPAPPMAPPAPPPPPSASAAAVAGAALPLPAPQPPPRALAAAGKQVAFTYYCEKSSSYYPRATTCQDGWIATPVNPPQ